MFLLILFDGSNHITRRFNGKKFASENKLKDLYSYAKNLNEGYPSLTTTILIDHSTYYNIDKQAWLESQISAWNIFMCEKGHDADEYLIGFLKIAPEQVLIVSKDKFRDKKYKIPKVCESLKWRFEPQYEKGRLRIPGLKRRIKKILSKKELFVDGSFLYSKFIDRGDIYAY